MASRPIRKCDKCGDEHPCKADAKKVEETKPETKVEETKLETKPETKKTETKPETVVPGSGIRSLLKTIWEGNESK